MLYCKRRSILYRRSDTPRGMYLKATKRRGWFMGDPMTKYLLAIS
jgi:hypothetical protein